MKRYRVLHIAFVALVGTFVMVFSSCEMETSKMVIWMGTGIWKASTRWRMAGPVISLLARCSGE